MRFKWVNINMMQLVSRRFNRFILVGILNTAVGYTIFFIALKVGLQYPLAIAVATILGTLFNFKSIGVLVFGISGYSQILRFIGVYLVIYIFNVLGVATLISFNLSEWLAGLILMCPLALLSYHLNRRFVFNI